MIQKAEKNHGDFVNTFTGDPIAAVYWSKQSSDQ